MGTFTIAPNPTKGTVVLRPGDMRAGPVQVTHINTAEQRVLTAQRTVKNTVDDILLDVGALPPGVYACALRSASEGVCRARFVKE